MTKTNTHNMGMLSGASESLRGRAALVDVRRQSTFGLIAERVESVGRRITAELRSDVPAVSAMLSQAGQYRGKMLRPALVLLAGSGAGDLKPEHELLAAVTEMIHLAALVHDDVLDESELRRSQPTMNALHGNEAAVMLGDLLLSHAYRLSGQLPGMWVSQRLAETTVAVCEGELTQLCSRGVGRIDESKYFQIIERKTASLMATCCYLGAKLAGGDEAMCRGLDGYGLNLGIAYQIADDLTDFVGDESHEGKTLRRDLATRKVTLAQIHYYGGAGESDRRWIEKVLANPEPGDYSRLVERLTAGGSVSYASVRARRYVERACECLPVRLSAAPQEALRQLAMGLIDELPGKGVQSKK